MSECNRGVWQLGHANVLLMFFLGPWLRVLLLRRRESEALKRILRTAYAFFFFFLLLPDKYSTRWLLILFLFLLEDGAGENKARAFLCAAVWCGVWVTMTRSRVCLWQQCQCTESDSDANSAFIPQDTEQNSWAHGAHIGHMEPQMEGSDKAQP